MSEGIAIQLIVTFGGIVAAYFVSRQQWRKDKVDAEGSREERLDKREADFWKRAEIADAENEKRIAALERKLADQDATIDQQGAEIMQLRDRIKMLESDRDHWKERALKAERTTQGKTGL